MPLSVVLVEPLAGSSAVWLCGGCYYCLQMLVLLLRRDRNSVLLLRRDRCNSSNSGAITVIARALCDSNSCNSEPLNYWRYYSD